MANFGGGAGPGNSLFFQGALSSARGITSEDMNRLIEAYKKEGRPLPNLNPPQGTNPRPIAVGVPSTMQIGNMEGMKLAHGIHRETGILPDGRPFYRTVGGHDPSQHNAPVDPSGNPILELKPGDENIPLYGMPITLSSTAFPVGNYINKTVS